MKLPIYIFFALVNIVLGLFVTNNLAIAQSVQTDGTTPTQPESCLGDCNITGGLKQDSNLFHSFENFNVDLGAKVLFQDPGVANILSRVTGNQLSEILGTLGVSGGDANLFLINPNGIIFGEDSRLDLNGSFLATTADAIRFGEQGLLDTATGEIPLLTINPSALAFAQGNKGIIRNESTALIGQNPVGNDILGLRVPDGESLLFVGGDVIVDGGNMRAFGGRIELAGLGGAGEVNLSNFNGDQGSIKLSFPEQFQGANVSISNKALIDTVSPSGDGGEIFITGENITVSDEGELATATINAANFDSKSGDITLNANKKLEIDNGQINNQVLNSGNSGDIILNAGSLLIKGSSSIQTSNFGEGNAGSIKMNVPNGKIEIRGNSPDENPTINTSVSSSLSDDAVGNSGKIEIFAQKILFDNNSVIKASSFGRGNSGDIEISVKEDLILSSNSGISSIIEANAIGKAAKIKIETRNLFVQDGSEIKVSAEGRGEAGSIEIEAQNIVLNNGSLNAETRVGDQGNITLSNVDILNLSNNSQITTNATESATGGNITIDSRAIALLNDSDITANAVQGQGGNIQITSQGIFQDPDSKIDAASEKGIDGTIAINSLDVDPTSGIYELPDIPVDPQTIVSQNLCKFENEKIAKGSSFRIIGQGGLAPTSAESLDNRDRIVSWAKRDDLEVSKNGSVGIRQRESTNLSERTYPKIQQSQGLLVKEDGSTWLTVDAPQAIAQSSKAAHPDCQRNRNLKLGDS